MLNIAIRLFALFLTLYPGFSWSSEHINVSPQKSVNILTWWEYLRKPDLIKKAEAKCKVKISFDEYFSNDEFLRRWEAKNNNYDIIIFSETIYNVMKNKIPIFENSTLWRQSKFYNPTIKAHYIKMEYPHNVAYFVHSMTGFLWNPDNINISESDSVLSIFKKAKNNLVIIVDDPLEGKKLLEEGIPPNKTIKDSVLLKDFKNITQNASVFITSNYNQIYSKPNFAFSFIWSGEAVTDLMRSKKNYKFLIHPKLSYIGSDLITQTTNNDNSLCVAKFLSSKDISPLLQEKDYYFSPYTNFSKVQNSFFKEIYRQFTIKLPTLKWIASSSINENDFNKINDYWQIIKISLNNDAKR